ncbi:MAG: hypothetical protein ABIJ61_14675 [bacterium]
MHSPPDLPGGSGVPGSGSDEESLPDTSGGGTPDPTGGAGAGTGASGADPAAGAGGGDPTGGGTPDTSGAAGAAGAGAPPGTEMPSTEAPADGPEESVEDIPEPEPAAAEAPGGESCEAGGTCIPCTTGNLQVTVKKLAVCWDTGPDGLDAEDTPLSGASVRVSGPSSPEAQETDESGVTLFQALQPGEYTVSVTYQDEEAHSYDMPNDPVTGTVEIHATAEVEAVLKRQGLECMRKHPVSSGTQGGPWIWLPVFWVFWSEPWIMIIRDVLWLTCMTFIVLGAAVWQDPAMAALFSALWAFFSWIIFGMIVGIIFSILAFILFGFCFAAAISAAAMAFLGFPTTNPIWFAMCAATWVAFIYAVAINRREPYSPDSVMWKVVCVIGMVLGMAIGLVCLILLGGAMNPYLLYILGLAMSAICGFAAAFFAHIFTNEGNSEVTDWQGGFKLPYEGDRYCVQGSRGFVSHYGWQEKSNDFAIKEGEDVLCAREGHVIAFKQDRTGTAAGSGNNIPNFVKVRHRDGSIAEYLHGKRNGVTSANHALIGAGYTQAGTGDNADYRNEDNPVYVQTGQVLCHAGNVGISMFAHIHFTIRHAPGAATGTGDAANFAGIHFDDEDVSGHEGRVWSMRKYHSDNENKGPAEVPDNVAEVDAYP